MNDTIYTLKNYGTINIKLRTIIDKKGISRSKLSAMVALSYDLVNRYYNNRVTRVDLDVISRFCYVLGCNVNDVLEYENEKSKA